jgi:hypothetical protein
LPYLIFTPTVGIATARNCTSVIQRSCVGINMRKGFTRRHGHCVRCGIIVKCSITESTTII